MIEDQNGFSSGSDFQKNPPSVTALSPQRDGFSFSPLDFFQEIAPGQGI